MRNKMARVCVIILVVFVVLQIAASQKCSRRCRSCLNNVADCGKLALTNPPKDFPRDTRIINIDGNYIRVFGRRSFQNLNRAEVLKARGNRVRVIRTHAFKNLPLLMTLDLSNNKIGKIYTRGLEGLKHLKTLSMSHNSLKSVSSVFDKVPTLYQLNLAFNRIQIIGVRDFAMNTHLHYLDLRNNKIAKIHPDAFKSLIKLRYLFLNNNPLVMLPELNIGSQVLQLVDLSNTRLREAPRGIPWSVSDLRLGNNFIQHIKKNDFENITNLRLLALNNNRLLSIEQYSFDKLRRLQEVWLRGNRLTRIPRGLPDNLRKLYMDSNWISRIDGKPFNKDSQLDYITLEKNKIVNISTEAFTGLRFLKTLNLNGNRIMTLKEGLFHDIKNLTSLSLSNNPIVKIEDGVFQNLNNLTYLYISYVTNEDFLLEGNFLYAMPNLQKLGFMNSPGLAQNFVKILSVSSPVMQHLKEIDLTYNDIETLPEVMKTIFPEIQAISIDGNALQCDKRLLWLKRWMESTDIKFFSYEEPVCEGPYNVKGRLIEDLPSHQFGEVVRKPDFDAWEIRHRTSEYAVNTGVRDNQAVDRTRTVSDDTVVAAAAAAAAVAPTEKVAAVAVTTPVLRKITETAKSSRKQRRKRRRRQRKDGTLRRNRRKRHRISKANDRRRRGRKRDRGWKRRIRQRIADRKRAATS